MPQLFPRIFRIPNWPRELGTVTAQRGPKMDYLRAVAFNYVVDEGLMSARYESKYLYIVLVSTGRTFHGKG